MDRQTDTCQNITFPQPSDAGGNDVMPVKWIFATFFCAEISSVIFWICETPAFSMFIQSTFVWAVVDFMLCKYSM